MDGARLEVGLEPHPDGFGAGGRELVELRVATNPGMPLAPLRETASGGELSRVMLALTGLGPAGGGDGGLRRDRRRRRRQGGAPRRRAAAGAGRRAAGDLHHPPAAGRLAGRGPFPGREVGRRATATVARVERSSGDELVAEIVRMLGAESDDEAAGRHARELLAA